MFLKAFIFIIISINLNLPFNYKVNIFIIGLVILLIVSSSKTLSWKEIYLSIDYDSDDDGRSKIDLPYEGSADEIVIRSKMIELVHHLDDSELDLLERYYEGKIKRDTDMERAKEIIEIIKGKMDGLSYSY